MIYKHTHAGNVPDSWMQYKPVELNAPASGIQSKPYLFVMVSSINLPGGCSGMLPEPGQHLLRTPGPRQLIDDPAVTEEHGDRNAAHTEA